MAKVGACLVFLWRVKVLDFKQEEYWKEGDFQVSW
jgi:hypothetical protein